MFCLNDTMRYWLCPGRTDMRKGISSLCGVVHEKMRSDVRNGDVFIFIGASRKLMKLLHAEDGGMEQRQREDMLYKFSNGSANVLVATDLASRGLDIPNIQNVIHYHLPESEEGYIHRVGRTARWDAIGRTFFILNSEEHIPDYVDGDVESYTPSPITPNPFPPRMSTLYIGKGKKDKLSKGDIVGFLCKKGELTVADIGRIDVKDRYTYVAIRREKLQQVLRLTKGEKIKGIRTIIEPVK